MLLSFLIVFWSVFSTPSAQALEDALPQICGKVTDFERDSLDPKLANFSVVVDGRKLLVATEEPEILRSDLMMLTSAYLRKGQICGYLTDGYRLTRIWLSY